MQAAQFGPRINELENIWFYPPNETGTSKLTLKFHSKAPPNFTDSIPENLRGKIFVSQPHPLPYASQKVKALSERMLSIKIQESDSKSMLIAFEILGYIQQKNPKIDVFPIEIVSCISSFNSIYFVPPDENGNSKLTFEFKNMAPTNPSKYIPAHLQPNAFLSKPKNSPYYSPQVKALSERVISVIIQESDTKSISRTLEILDHTIKQES